MGFLAADSALAHVKWFAHFEVGQQPAPLTQALGPYFWIFLAIATLAIIVVSIVEYLPIGQFVNRQIDHFCSLFRFRDRIEDMIRGSTAVFFILIGMMGGVILTPELKTAAEWIPLLQVAIGIGMFWRRTMLASAIGIVFLYSYGVYQYGFFHMLDYPLFLGLALYIGLRSLRKNLFGFRPLQILRFGAAITLIWASVEKWAYPEWSFPVLHAKPEISMGMTPSIFMDAAGVVEFMTAFGLLLSPLIRRLSALTLLVIFVSAIFSFGKIDAIGHLMIIIVLIAIFYDDQPSRRWTPIKTTIMVSIALLLDLLLYYSLHAVAYGTRIF